MELIILWAGFVGGWLLVAGPVFQASVELREEEVDRAGISAAAARIEAKPISPWWWLLPPVAYLLNQRAQRRFREAAFAAMTGEQREQFVSFTQKARGWLIVAFGAFFIAAKETWELAEASHWWPWVFWVLLVLMPAACLIYTVRSVISAERQLGHAMPERRPGRPAASDPQV